MPYAVTRKKIVNNDVLMPQVLSNTLPEEGWYYHSDGETTYQYVFATAGTGFDASFPPSASELSSSTVLYWYRAIGGGPGEPPHLVRLYSLFLGDETEDALFIGENPVGAVNGSTSDLTNPVSTANGQVDITPVSQLHGQDFMEWVPIWGPCQANQDHLIAAQNTDCAVVAVYGYPAPVRPPKFQLEKVFRELIDPQDLVADYLDERFGLVKLLDKAVLDNDDKAKKMVDSALNKTEMLDSRTTRLKLAGIKSDIKRMQAIEEILASLVKK